MGLVLISCFPSFPQLELHIHLTRRFAAKRQPNLVGGEISMAVDVSIKLHFHTTTTSRREDREKERNRERERECEHISRWKLTKTHLKIYSFLKKKFWQCWRWSTKFDLNVDFNEDEQSKSNVTSFKQSSCRTHTFDGDVIGTKFKQLSK